MLDFEGSLSDPIEDFRFHTTIHVSEYFRRQQRTIRYHDTLRKVRLCYDDCPERFQDLNNGSIPSSGLESSRDVSYRRIDTFDIELVLERDGHSMKRSDQFSLLLIILIESIGFFHGIVEEDLCQTVCLEACQYDDG